MTFSSSGDLAQHWEVAHGIKITSTVTIPNKSFVKIYRHGKLEGVRTRSIQSKMNANAKRVRIETTTTSSENGDKLSKCPFCPRQFEDAQLRLQHVLFGAHHFSCDKCQLQFENLSSKNEHELTMHSCKNKEAGSGVKTTEGEEAAKTAHFESQPNVIKTEPSWNATE